MKFHKIAFLIFSCAFLFLANTFSYAEDSKAPTPPLSGHVENGVRIIEIEAFKYGYNPTPIVVKEGEKVRFLLTSKDVMHGFGIADLGIDVKIPPKKTTTFEFTPKQTGTYEIRCTSYCGIGHGNMRGKLIVIK